MSGGIGVNSNQSTYAVTTAEVSGARVTTIHVNNPDAPVTDEDVLAFENLLNETFGRRVDLPAAHEFQTQDELMEFAAGMMNAIDNITADFDLVIDEKGHIAANLVVTDANMQNGQLDSLRTSTARQNNTVNLMQEFVAIMAQIIATQSETQTMLGLSSQQDIFNAYDANLKAAEQKKKAAESKYDADIATANSKMLEGCLQVAGGAIGAFGGVAKPLDGIAQSVSGVGKVAAAATFDRTAADKNREATLLNIEAEKFQSAGQLQQNMGGRKEQAANNIQQSINATLQSLKSFSDVMHQTTMNMAGNLGR
ncbi:MAG: hypothetical protein LBD72_02800 [Puniceicoccales bacterium]|jgi:hypothetical protein|nr:hypothetical protein [Puniceicoccales bacterium]